MKKKSIIILVLAIVVILSIYVLFVVRRNTNQYDDYIVSDYFDTDYYQNIENYDSMIEGTLIESVVYQSQETNNVLYDSEFDSVTQRAMSYVINTNGYIVESYILKDGICVVYCSTNENKFKLMTTDYDTVIDVYLLD